MVALAFTPQSWGSDLNAERSRHTLVAYSFMKVTPWKGLEKGKVEVKTLQIRLQAKLENHIR